MTGQPRDRSTSCISIALLELQDAERGFRSIEDDLRPSGSECGNEPDRPAGGACK